MTGRYQSDIEDLTSSVGLAVVYVRMGKSRYVCIGPKAAVEDAEVLFMRISPCAKICPPSKR